MDILFGLALVCIGMYMIYSEFMPPRYEIKWTRPMRVLMAVAVVLAGAACL